MLRGRVVEIDLSLALEAAVNGLPMAESLIYSAARRHGAVLWTQDAHFDGLPGVTYFRKPLSCSASADSSGLKECSASSPRSRRWS